MKTVIKSGGIRSRLRRKELDDGLQEHLMGQAAQFICELSLRAVDLAVWLWVLKAMMRDNQSSALSRLGSSFNAVDCTLVACPRFHALRAGLCYSVDVVVIKPKES